MAEDLTKEILPIAEEQKQEKKLLYKNWKIYATALGIITVGLAVGLGVGLGVQNSSHNTVSTEQKIVNEINSTTNTYTLTTNINATAANITNQINSDFIKAKLTGDNATAFKTKSFKFNTITVGEDNHILADNDLTTTGTINAKINYSYDTITKQTTILTITVSMSEQQKIVNAINNITYTLPAITASNDNTAASITDQINSDFIKAQLTGDNATAFKTESFKFNTVTIGDNVLKDGDLTTAGTINAKINYSYDTITNQSTSLTFRINHTDSEIVNAITNTTYKLTTVTVGDKAADVIAKINDSFIKSSLQDEIQTSFDSDSFKLDTITVGKDNHILADNDLTTTGTINAKINYSYDTITNQSTSLTFWINNTDSEIVNAITNTTYTIAAYTNDTTTNITTQITGDFIKAQLTGNIATSFDSDLFKLDIITVGEDNHALADNDLTTATTLDATISFKYDGKTASTTNLKITTKNINENEIINTITNTTFNVKADLGGEVASVNNQITDDFIINTLSKISSGISEAFKKDIFEFNSITTGDDNHTLADNDLLKVRDFDGKINYTYNSKTSSTNLVISIGIDSIITNGIDISKFVTDSNSNLTLNGVTTTSSDDEIKQSIINALIPIIADILGDYWNDDTIRNLIETSIAGFVKITLDTADPHKSAVIEGNPDAILKIIKGSANVTFTLATA